MTAFLFQNFSTPEFPSRNIDTVVLKWNSSGDIAPTTPHLPIVDFTRDGRVGLLLKQETQV